MTQVKFKYCSTQYRQLDLSSNPQFACICEDNSETFSVINMQFHRPLKYRIMSWMHMSFTDKSVWSTLEETPPRPIGNERNIWEMHDHVIIFLQILLFIGIHGGCGLSSRRRWLLPGTWSHLWFAGVRGCPPWYSIVGAIVIVHPSFCILNFCHTCSLCRVELVVQFAARGSTQVLLCLFLVCCGCDTSYIVSVHIQPPYIHFRCVAGIHSGCGYPSRRRWLLPGTWSHLWFAGVRECPPWCSIVGATVTVYQFFCNLHFLPCSWMMTWDSDNDSQSEQSINKTQLTRYPASLHGLIFGTWYRWPINTRQY